jgi:hypothetical protein
MRGLSCTPAHGIAETKEDAADQYQAEENPQQRGGAEGYFGSLFFLFFCVE